LLGASGNLLAAESTGRYFENLTSESTTMLADGRTVVLFTTKQHAISDQADDPFHEVTADCTGRLVYSKDGAVLSGSGMCFVKDADGDGVNQAWKVEAAGTADCPGLCGSFRIIDAYGKFKGTTASGTWKRTHVFADGTAGTFKSSYTRT
jgi:hypothetical protein